ncbi:MAG TPA: hypothetical protein VJ998_05415, partial [Pseudomonadales bacterium]|nr:hypothetical protein [Pseudomonadales bacterium]
MKIALTLRLVLYPTAVLLGLAIFLAHLALFSETGGHWIAGQIEKRVEGLQLAYRGGTVARGLDFTDVRLSRPGLDISAHGVSIKVNLPAMLAGKIKLQRVGVRALAVSYKAVQAPGTPSSPVDITTSITIADAHVENAVVRIDDAAPIRLDTAEASVALSGEHLQLHDVRVRQSTLVVRGTWQMVLNAPYTFGGQFNLAGIAQGVPPIVGHLRGDSEKIRIGAGFAPPDNVTMSANIDPAKGRFDASADITTLDLKALTGQPLALTGGALEAAGEYRNFRYSGHASVDNPWLSHLNAKLSGNFSGETLDVSGLHMLADRTSVDGSGNYDFATHT